MKKMSFLLLLLFSSAFAQTTNNNFEAVVRVEPPQKIDNNEQSNPDNDPYQLKNNPEENKSDDSDVLFVQNIKPARNEWQALIQAKEKNYDEIELAIKNGTNINNHVIDSYTALHLAGMQNNLRLAEFVLSHKPNILALSKNNVTPLHWAASNQTPLIIRSELSQLSAKDLIAANNKVDKEGRTPLHYNALYFANLEIAQILLNNKFDPNVQDKNGQTPLHYAIACRKWDLAQLLIKNGAKLSIKDKNGTSAEELLMEHGATEAFVKLYSYLQTDNQNILTANLANLHLVLK
jgi:ankyrin repeat protein